MMSFSDLDLNLQRSVFSAVSILSILFLLCILSKWVLYGFFGVSLFATGFIAYNMFIKPVLNKNKKKSVKRSG